MDTGFTDKSKSSHGANKGCCEDQISQCWHTLGNVQMQLGSVACCSVQSSLLIRDGYKLWCEFVRCRDLSLYCGARGSISGHHAMIATWTSRCKYLAPPSLGEVLWLVFMSRFENLGLLSPEEVLWPVFSSRYGNLGPPSLEDVLWPVFNAAAAALEPLGRMMLAAPLLSLPSWLPRCILLATLASWPVMRSPRRCLPLPSPCCPKSIFFFRSACNVTSGSII